MQLSKNFSKEEVEKINKIFFYTNLQFLLDKPKSIDLNNTQDLQDFCKTSQDFNSLTNKQIQNLFDSQHKFYQCQKIAFIYQNKNLLRDLCKRFNNISRSQTIENYYAYWKKTETMFLMDLLKKTHQQKIPMQVYDIDFYSQKDYRDQFLTNYFKFFEDERYKKYILIQL